MFRGKRILLINYASQTFTDKTEKKITHPKW